MSAPAEAGGGAFAPLRSKVFAWLWAATVVGNAGSFMRDVASAWTAADLGASPVAVAMVQAAATAPAFLLALPAGVLADIVDRRRLLLGIQLLMAAASVALSLLAFAGALTLPALVGLTFVAGVGAALMGPVWQSIVPELVERPQLKSAVALNSLGVNISRSIGPALGGLLLATVGTGATYLADVSSYVFVIATLLWWKRPAAADDGLAERFPGAFRAGLRYARASSELRRTLVRALMFFPFGAAIWALMPLVSRNLLGGDAGFYGLMLGAVGAGAIGGALLLPGLRAKLDGDGIMLASAVAVAGAMALLATGPGRIAGLALAPAIGAAWIAALTTLSGTAQAVLPNWVRGRGLAVYLTVFNGAMTAGSLGWGLVADGLGLRGALLAAAAGLCVAAWLARRLPLPEGDEDLTPSNHWPEPAVAAPPAHDRGPVLVTVEYRVAPEDLAAFRAAMDRLAPMRRRDGAYAWGLAEDAAEPERITEWFMVESWAEHLRQHARVSGGAADVQVAARRWHRGEDPPRVRHLIGLPPLPAPSRPET
ncbi:MFS transporter [Albimonas sp. CAU 1670]|uniref:MFS transporter n=1 Tax=Albimonas sp. CAU 1670 TaxID=3032599 RepID=UPI0023DA2897|nr:MFS transporter [Albimonas sp. CAU 1670]MDF2234105.1 MFS transporter [Albimonas sp. CAU 1670]